MKMLTSSTAQHATSAGKRKASPSAGSLILTVATIMLAAVVTGTVAMVAIAAIGEVSRQINTAAINDFFDLIATIFFTILNVIATGTESVQRGLMMGLYAGVAISIGYLAISWFSLRKRSQYAPIWRR